MAEYVCATCNKKFRKPPSRLNKYCSRNCKYGVNEFSKGSTTSTMIIKSPKHGTFVALFDTQDLERIMNCGKKWTITIARDKPYASIHTVRNGRKGSLQLHRFLLNPPQNTYVDHINQDTLDNRRVNMRICSNSANLRNARLRPDNKSGYTGVFKLKDNKGWMAYIKVKYKRIHLGQFKTKEEAVKVRRKAELQYFNI